MRAKRIHTILGDAALAAASVLVALVACLVLSGCGQGVIAAGGSSAPSAQAATSGLEVREDGAYTSRDEVALFLHEYGHLPDNYITKGEARKAGWVPSEGNLGEACPGKSIGGGAFHDDDGQLPAAPGRTWRECDIGYEGGYRGPERIVFSNDGLVYYTGDHYKAFERLY